VKSFPLRSIVVIDFASMATISTVVENAPDMVMVLMQHSWRSCTRRWHRAARAQCAMRARETARAREGVSGPARLAKRFREMARKLLYESRRVCKRKEVSSCESIIG
jgi:hypothetical protein